MREVGAVLQSSAGRGGEVTVNLDERKASEGSLSGEGTGILPERSLAALGVLHMVSFWLRMLSAILVYLSKPSSCFRVYLGVTASGKPLLLPLTSPRLG